MTLVVNPQISLSEFQPQDQVNLVRYLDDAEIYRQTLRIPSPYTEEHARGWLDKVANVSLTEPPCFWAIRDEIGELIGSCGMEAPPDVATHRAEIGYWLARPFWGRGIMTDVVRRVTEHAFDDFGLQKVTAEVFRGNEGSARVLEKNGFQCEATLPQQYLKDGRLIDVRVFARYASQQGSLNTGG